MHGWKNIHVRKLVKNLSGIYVTKPYGMGSAGQEGA